MNIIGIQFLKNSISVAYYNKNKLTGSTTSTEHIIDDSEYAIILNKIFTELGLLHRGKCKVVISIPNDLVEVFALKQLVPVTKKFISSKGKQNLILGQIESVLEKNTQDYMIEYDIIDEKQLYNGKLLVTIINSRVEDITQYISKITPFKNLIPIAVDTEYEALRRLIPAEEKNLAIINFFTNDKEYVGIYIYRGYKLIGIRYLYKNLYDSESIISEVERMVLYCKTFYRDFEPDNWYAFGKEEYIEDIMKYENIQKHELSTCPFAVGAGLALKEEYEKRKLKSAKKTKLKGGVN